MNIPDHPVIRNMERYGYPDGDAHQAVFICSGCGNDILAGDKVWHIMGEQFCKRCIDNAEETAEPEDYYETY